MTEITQEPKICPSCRVLTPFDQLKKIVSRSSGKSTNSWRCVTCIKKISDAKRAATKN